MDKDSGPRTAMVFPGMAPSRFADVSKFMLINPYARKMIAEADKKLGYSLVENFRDAEGDYSPYGQICFMINCLALAKWAEQELGIEAEYATGPSFGEKPTAVYSGALPFAEGVWVTAEIARCLDEYFASNYHDVVTHSFVRVTQEKLAEVIGELTDDGVWCEISCYIDTDFHMVSLRERNLDWFKQKIRSLGGMSLYTMRPPLHADVFGGLRRKIEDEVLGALPFVDPTLPVIADQDGMIITTGNQVRTMLLDSIVEPMRWTAVVESLKQVGVTRVCVAGPDSLFGRVRCTNDAFEVVAVNTRLALQPRRRGAGPTKAA
jgi:malonyl CoA-acyl carrier protein transacylase